MAKNYIQEGEVLTVLAPSGGVASGDPVLVGALFGVAATSALEAVEFELMTSGVFTLPKATGATWAIGDPLYWDASAKKLTKVAGDSLQVAIATAIAGSSDATGNAKLNELGAKLTGLAAPQAAITDLSAITGGEAPTEAEHNAIVTKVNLVIAALRVANIITD